MSQQIIVEISPAGEVKVEAKGVRGSGCQQLTAALEKALGQTTGDTKSAEYFQTAQQGAGQQSTQGAK